MNNSTAFQRKVNEISSCKSDYKVHYYIIFPDQGGRIHCICPGGIITDRCQQCEIDEKEEENEPVAVFPAR